MLYLHFTMADNPGLSEETRRRYERRYAGAFYRRFVLGEWTVAQGRVYDFFTREDYVRPPPEGEAERYCISVDYGTANPCSFGLWGRYGRTWYRVAEYYYASRDSGIQLTDQEYVAALRRLAGGHRIHRIVADPSAASFITALRRENLPVCRAKNDVLSGIRLTADLLKAGRLVICPECADCLREIESYCWAESGDGRERVRKENDHAMDDMRYFAATIAAAEDEAGAEGALAVERPGSMAGALDWRSNF